MIILFLIFFQTVFADEPTLRLHVGEQKKIEFLGADTNYVEPAEIVSIEDLGGEILITGKASGSAYIRSDESTVVVEVLEPDSKPFVKKQSIESLSGMLGPQLKPQNGIMHVTGQIHRVEDWLQIKETFKSRPFEIHASVDDDIKEKIILKLKDELNASNRILPIIHWQKPITAILTTNAKNDFKAQNDETTKILRSWGVRVKVETSDLQVQSLIRINIQFVELEKFASRRLGVLWPSSYNFQLIPSTSKQEPFSLLLESLSSNGQAKILASPSLVAKNGGEAEFLAGGEIPIPVRSLSGRDVKWKKYGVSLKINPSASPQGNIDLKVQTEISSIDASAAVDGIPGIKTNTMNSSFTLLSKQTLAVSGLIRVQTGNNKSGLVGLSDLPILGSLFSSQNFLEQKSEMVIFVTPELVDINTL